MINIKGHRQRFNAYWLSNKWNETVRARTVVSLLAVAGSTAFVMAIKAIVEWR